MHPDSLIGEVVGGRYVVERIIGKGGMGTIYEVSHQILGRKFAMKTLSAHLVDDPNAAARLRREADSVAKLRHPNVVDIFGWEHLADGSPCIVMEFLRGEDLRERIRREGPMPWSSILRIAEEVLSALEVAHAAGIVHRDLKPPNIFLARDDAGNETAKLLDFGLSKIREARGMQTTNSSLLGTPSYMAPEQAHGRHEQIGPHTDLWAMGAILHEMATGEVAYPGIAAVQVLYRICYGDPDSLREGRADAPELFVELVTRCLAREADQRVPSAGELRRELAASLASVITGQVPVMAQTGPYRFGTPTGKDRLVTLPIATAAAAAAPSLSGAPASNLTFLFAEIVDSARLWEEHPDAMSEAITRNESVMLEAISFHGGRIFKTTGDSCSAVFDEPQQAVGAALAAQRMLERAPWGATGRLEVRMAIHTGPAHERGGDYFGPTLNRIARILALARGRQIVLSGATTDQVRERDLLPPDASLEDLGIHPLRDLTRPEHIYQLTHPDLCSENSALLTVAKVRNNLPHALSSFVGRKRELADVREQLRKHRLVTVTGVGGCGKTRVALQVAADATGEFADGVWLVELATLTDAELVAQTVGQVLDIPREAMFAASVPWLERLAQHLEDKRVLLVLDNCEHVLQGCSTLAGALLRRCRQLRILAASRERLGVEGEVSYLLSPLTTPNPASPQEALEVDSVRLFAERARLQKPDFTLTAENLDAVCRICRELEGIPLAIELAASRVSVLSVESLAQRLRDRFSLLSGRQNASPRQKSLRATLDWSYDLLSREEQLLFGRLSVFRGSFPLAAVEAICAGGEVSANQVLDLLSQLTQRSLVKVISGDGEPRYQLLDILREYAHGKLAETADATLLPARHRDWYIELAERDDPQLRGPQQTAYLDELESEFDNVRAALKWALEKDQGRGTLRLCGALWWFWMIRGHHSEGRRHLEEALAGESDAPPSVRGRALAGCGLLTVFSDPIKSKALFDESLSIARQQEDAAGAALACLGLGWQALYAGDIPAMQRWLSESRRIYIALGDTWGRGMACMFLSLAVGPLGDPDAAQEISREGVEAFHQSGDRLGLGIALVNSGEAARAHGDDGKAAEFYEKALAVCREAGDRTGTAIALTNLSVALSSQGDFLRAELRLRESLALSLEMRMTEAMVPVCLLGFAGVAAARGEGVRAARLLGASLAIQEAAGGHFHPADSLYYERTFSRLKEMMGPDSMLSEWKNGERLSLTEAIHLARGPIEPSHHL